MNIKPKDWVKPMPGGIAFKGRFIGEDGKNFVYGLPQGGVYVGIARDQIGHTVDGLVFVPEWLAVKHKQFWDAA